MARFIVSRAHTDTPLQQTKPSVSCHTILFFCGEKDFACTLEIIAGDVFCPAAKRGALEPFDEGLDTRLEKNVLSEDHIEALLNEGDERESKDLGRGDGGDARIRFSG